MRILILILQLRMVDRVEVNLVQAPLRAQEFQVRVLQVVTFMLAYSEEEEEELEN